MRKLGQANSSALRKRFQDGAVAPFEAFVQQGPASDVHGFRHPAGLCPPRSIQDGTQGQIGGGDRSGTHGGRPLANMLISAGAILTPDSHAARGDNERENEAVLEAI